MQRKAAVTASCKQYSEYFMSTYLPDGGGTETVDSKNFYIVASAPNEPSLQVKISGPYLTKQAAQADLSAAIVEAKDIDPSAANYDYSIDKVESRKPGVIQHMASHA